MALAFFFRGVTARGAGESDDLLPRQLQRRGRAHGAGHFDFLGAWFPGDPRADFNGVGGVTVQDIFDFLAAWFSGC